MSHVNHHIGNGEYTYDHFRVSGEKNVRCVYVGPAGQEYTTSRLMDNGFREREGYEERHRKASELEKEKYGQKRFDELNQIIREKLEPSELAGKYEIDEHGKVKVIVNEKIPEKYHKQIIYHEIREAELEEHQKDGAHRHDKGDPEGPHDHPQYEGLREGYKGNIQAQRKYERVMREYHEGRLFTKRGKFEEKVTDEKQAKAIAYSEARKTDEDYGKQ